jgi:hypothetical protein
MKKIKIKGSTANGEHVQEGGNNTNTSTLLQMEVNGKRRFFK